MAKASFAQKPSNAQQPSAMTRTKRSAALAAADRRRQAAIIKKARKGAEEQPIKEQEDEEDNEQEEEEPEKPAEEEKPEKPAEEEEQPKSEKAKPQPSEAQSDDDDEADDEEEAKKREAKGQPRDAMEAKGQPRDAMELPKPDAESPKSDQERRRRGAKEGSKHYMLNGKEIVIAPGQPVPEGAIPGGKPRRRRVGGVKSSLPSSPMHQAGYQQQQPSISEVAIINRFILNFIKTSFAQTPPSDDVALSLIVKRMFDMANEAVKNPITQTTQSEREETRIMLQFVSNALRSNNLTCIRPLFVPPPPPADQPPAEQPPLLGAVMSDPLPMLM